jgi:hypothetical protein
MFLKLARPLLVVAVLLGIAAPATATSITVLVGNKDWFGTNQAGKTPGVDLMPFDDSQFYDFRSSAEASATNGAQLTDVYSALYPNDPSMCDPIAYPGCNRPSTGSVVFSLTNNALLSGTITFVRGGFQCTAWGPLTADVNGIPIGFCFDDGNDDTTYQKTGLGSITLTPGMIAAANAAGELRLNIFHNVARPEPGEPGSLDYVAFDYFELNAEVAPVPEPGTLVLVGLGAAAIGISFSRAGARGRSRVSAAGHRR